MTTISVASGKGGAGKTSIAAALASTLGKDCIFADCDVDAANGAIALGASIDSREPYFAGPGYKIQPSACTGCGRCHAVCRFSAIEPVAGAREFRIIQELCERCGACVDTCTTGAITTFEKQAGELFVSTSRTGTELVHAELEPGEDTSGKLVTLVRKRAATLAATSAATIARTGAVIVVDAPPGIGCPVIASITGCDLVLVVVEASASGVRDAGRLVELVQSMKRRSVAIINKTGLNASMDENARRMLSTAGIPVAGEIPFDPALRSAEEANLTWAAVDCSSAGYIQAALVAIHGVIDTIKEKQ